MFIAYQLFILVYLKLLTPTLISCLYELKGSTMVSKATLGPDEDLHAPLSGEALVKLMMEYCNTQIRENAKLERAFSRDLTNDKIEIVTNSFGEGIAVVARTINDHISSQNAKIAEMELEIKTFNTYFEQLINSLFWHNSAPK